MSDFSSCIKNKKRNWSYFRQLFSTAQSFFEIFFSFPWDVYLFLILFPKSSERIGRQWTHLIFVLAKPVFPVSKLFCPTVRNSTHCHWPFLPFMFEKCLIICLNILCNLPFICPLSSFQHVSLLHIKLQNHLYIHTFPRRVPFLSSPFCLWCFLVRIPSVVLCLQSTYRGNSMEM